MKLMRVGVDLAKSVFQVHGVDCHERGVWRRKLTRANWLRVFLETVEPGCEVGMEACGGAHHWARLLQARGYCGYLDFARLYRFNEAGSFFVTRAKSNLKAQRRYSHPVDRSTGLICDQAVTLTVFYSRQGFEAPLRRVRFKDPETGKALVFLTNNFTLPALTITQRYRQRWQIELFFKWIKQHLRINSFFGTSENAVKTQIWIALSALMCSSPSSRSDSTSPHRSMKSYRS